MMKQSLSGSDYFHLLLDRKMLRNGLVGNISRIHLELESATDLPRLEEKLSTNKTLLAVAKLRIKVRWPLLPIWKQRPTQSHFSCSQIHSNMEMAEFETIILNRKVDNQSGLVYLDLCALADGTKHLVVSMHHVLFDHQGMMNFMHALADDSITFPLFPKEDGTNLFKRMQNTLSMTLYMLSRSSWKLGSLVDRNTKPKAAPKFRIIEFDQDQTTCIETNAWKAGSRIGQSAFYMSAVGQIVLHIIQNRSQNPPYLWFSVPHDQRRKGTTGHLVSNQLSFFFFKLTPAQLKQSAAAVEEINAQLKSQIKDRVTERYEHLQASLRLMPMYVYEWMVDLASNGNVSSFGFSNLGEEKMPVSIFQGAQVIGTNHYPPVPSPPWIQCCGYESQWQTQVCIGVF